MPETTISPDERRARLDGPIHSFFGLSYSNYLVLHRTLMQSMPVEWQERAVALFRDLDAAFEHVEQAEAYEVTAATECEYSDLSDADMRQLGVTQPDEPADEHDERWERRYYDRDGNEHDACDRALVPRLGGDPIPHYNRGRTFIEPQTPVVSGV
ncbi:hypothetical protein K1W54_04925 [Micromonospora sp. CPCC 205371]|nr:hypothetical protein [Micromonospora sp. CPCC 205371]